MTLRALSENPTNGTFLDAHQTHPLIDHKNHTPQSCNVSCEVQAAYSREHIMAQPQGPTAPSVFPAKVSEFR